MVPQKIDEEKSISSSAVVKYSVSDSTVFIPISSRNDPRTRRVWVPYQGRTVSALAAEDPGFGRHVCIIFLVGNPDAGRARKKLAPSQEAMLMRSKK